MKFLALIVLFIHFIGSNKGGKSLEYVIGDRAWRKFVKPKKRQRFYELNQTTLEGDVWNRIDIQDWIIIQVSSSSIGGEAVSIFITLYFMWDRMTDPR